MSIKLKDNISANISKNANTATTLATARTINGTSFNGSANITTANWGTARNITIGNTAKSVNGSANVSWSLSEIGAAAASHTHSYLPLSGGTLTGNVTISTDSNLEWSRNTDYARISFKNTGDGDSDSYMHFLTGDNGNEYFKFSSLSGSTTTDLLTIKTDHLRYKGNAVYHSGNPQPNRGYRAECQSNGSLYATIDLSGLNADTYYPVVGSPLSADAVSVDIRVSVNLNSGTKPYWSSHNNGFTCQFHVLMKPCGWGTNYAESIILDCTYRWCGQNPVGYTQMNNASRPVLFLRGGGRYYVYSNEPVTWSVKTSSYTDCENTVSPSTSYPGVYIQRSQIYANLSGDVQSPSPWIKLGSRWLTIDSAAPSASVGDVWIQV